MDQRHRNAVVGFGFGLVVRKYSSERVLVMVVAGCTTTVGHVHYDRAVGSCRTLTPLYCFAFHPSSIYSFLFFFIF